MGFQELGLIWSVLVAILTDRCFCEGGQSESRGGYIQGNKCRLLTAAIMTLSLMAVAYECL